MGLANLIRRGEARDTGVGAMSWPDYLRLWEQFGFNGVQYMVPGGSMASITALQSIRNPIILACIMIRCQTFSEIRFAWQQLGRGKGTLFGNQELAILEKPWPYARTGHLLARMEMDVSRFGNSYWYRTPEDTLSWLDPAKMNIITGDQEGPSGKTCGQTLLGYQIVDKAGQPEETFLPHEIVHYKAIPDPNHPFRGMSWLSSLLPDVTADQDLTDFKRAYLHNAATPNLLVQFTANMGYDAFVAFRDKLEASHTGPANGFKTLYVGPGADVKTIGSTFEQMQLAQTQSIAEVRLCAAAGVPAIIVGVVEALKGSALNAGNYDSTRRRFADVTMRPLWREACNALEAVLPSPAGARLWYDESAVRFLQMDLTDAASTAQMQAETISSLVNAGYTPESVVTAITTSDWTALSHSGLYSIQLQPPGELGEPGGPTSAPAAPAEPTPAAA